MHTEQLEPASPIARADYYPVLEFIADRTRKASLLPDAWAMLRRLSAIADSGRFALEPEDAFDGGAASAAIAVAAGRSSDLIVTASLAERHDVLADPASYRPMFKDGLPVALELDRDVAAELWDVIDDALWPGIGPSVEATFAAGPWMPLLPLASDTLRDAIYLYLSHVIAGREDLAPPMLSYLDLCTRALPVGEFAENPGEWMVLKA